uniref:Putative secreted protein n=1 Tax=Anopheles marajoara TaxID=58244 RepID=A0A2M4CAU1_9DIPT
MSVCVCVCVCATSCLDITVTPDTPLQPPTLSHRKFTSGVGCVFSLSANRSQDEKKGNFSHFHAIVFPWPELGKGLGARSLPLPR